MRLVAIAGSIGEQSYNRMLVRFIARHYKDEVEKLVKEKQALVEESNKKLEELKRQKLLRQSKAK